jgi:D-glycero-beta-D-manno-heptose-7-phosphate kinase
MYKSKFPRFCRIISRLSRARVLVIGDVMLDRFIWGTVSRISPEAPVPVVWAQSESFMPGGASNVANNICSLGSQAHICGVIGDDEAGRILVSEFSKRGIHAEGIVLDKNRPTIHKTRIIAHHQQVVRIDKESDNTIDRHITDTTMSYIKSKIRDIDAIIIEDYGKGFICPRVIRQIISMAKRHKKIITVDPKEEHFKEYKGVTAITPNKVEAEEASGIKIRDNETLGAAGRKLLKILQSDAVLITLGEGGMALFERGKPYLHIPTVAQEVYDVSGAGDTVIGVFTLALASGASISEAAYMANAAAGVVVGKIGIGVCSAGELKFRLKNIKPVYRRKI